MNFVYTHSRKNDVLSIIREFLKTIQIRYEQIVRFIRMNDEQTLKIQYENFMKMREISTKRFVSYTSAQNDKIERFEKILMIKIKTMRISSHLSTNLWLEVIKTMSYLNNRISKKEVSLKNIIRSTDREEIEIISFTIVWMSRLFIEKSHFEKEKVEISILYRIFSEIWFDQHFSNLNFKSNASDSHSKRYFR
jgi:hypothetical protein